MTNLKVAVFTMLTASTFSVAAAQPVKSSRNLKPLSLVSTGGFGTISQTDCIGNPGTPVTVELGELFDSIATNGKVSRKIKRGANDVSYPKDVGNNWKTSLDMQLAVPKTTGGYQKNDYVIVTIVLPKTSKSHVNMQFLQQFAKPALDSSTAVMASSPTQSALFCGRTDIAPWTGDPTALMVKFGVKWGPVRSFNIGVMVQDKQDNTVWLPIILDPNVQNEG